MMPTIEKPNDAENEIGEKRGEKKKKGNKNRKRKKTVAIRTEKFFLLHSRPNQKVGVVTRITLCFTLHYCYA